MGDPMDPSDSEGNSEGGGMSRPGALGTQEKAPALSWVDRLHANTFERF
jgi:hypothetical protein